MHAYKLFSNESHFSENKFLITKFPHKKNIQYSGTINDDCVKVSVDLKQIQRDKKKSIRLTLTNY